MPFKPKIVKPWRTTVLRLHLCCYTFITAMQGRNAARCPASSVVFMLWLTAAVGSLCVQATGRRSFQSVSPSSWSVRTKQDPGKERTWAAGWTHISPPGGNGRQSFCERTDVTNLSDVTVPLFQADTENLPVWVDPLRRFSTVGNQNCVFLFFFYGWDRSGGIHQSPTSLPPPPCVRHPVQNSQSCSRLLIIDLMASTWKRNDQTLFPVKQSCCFFSLPPQQEDVKTNVHRASLTSSHLGFQKSKIKPDERLLLNELKQRDTLRSVVVIADKFCPNPVFDYSDEASTLMSPVLSLHFCASLDFPFHYLLIWKTKWVIHEDRAIYYYRSCLTISRISAPRHTFEWWFSTGPNYKLDIVWLPVPAQG